MFFKGIIEESVFEKCGKEYFGYALPLFVLWYHPKPSESEIDRLIEWACESSSNAISMNKARELCEKFRSSITRLDRDYSIFGGREELIARVLWGEPVIGAKFDQYRWDNAKNRHPRDADLGGQGSVTTRMELISANRTTRAFWSAVNLALRWGSELRYQKSVGQFLFNHANKIDEDLDEYSAITVRIVASNVLFFDDSPEIEDRETQAVLDMRDLMMKRYRSGLFCDVIQKIWEDVEKGNTLYFCEYDQ